MHRALCLVQQQLMCPPAVLQASRRDSKGPRYTDIPNSQIRKIIAQRLLESKQKIPHYYLSADADLGVVSSLRKSLKEQGQKVLLPSLLHLEQLQAPSASPLCRQGQTKCRVCGSVHCMTDLCSCILQQHGFPALSPSGTTHSQCRPVSMTLWSRLLRWRCKMCLWPMPDGTRRTRRL